MCENLDFRMFERERKREKKRERERERERERDVMEISGRV